MKCSKPNESTSSLYKMDMSETTPNSTRERRNETNQAAAIKNAYKRKDKTHGRKQQRSD